MCKTFVKTKKSCHKKKNLWTFPLQALVLTRAIILIFLSRPNYTAIVSIQLEALKYERILIYIEFISNLECSPYNKIIFLCPKDIHLAQKRVIF